MRIVRLEAENFKRLRSVEIAPDGNIVTIGGNNGEGKSSVLDAIYVALKGRAANPPKPVRQGEEKATIRLDMGDLVVTRTFTIKEGKPYTDTLKVENADGFRAGKPQETLDALLGEIGFDPFEFAQKDPKRQAATILEMVPLSVDLDEMRDEDAADRIARRDANRDRDALQAQVDAIPAEEVPADAPDREALTTRLTDAATINTGIAKEKAARDARQTQISNAGENVERLRAEAEQLRADAKAKDEAADDLETRAKAAADALAALPALDEPVDATALQAELREAEAVLARIARQQQRAGLVERLEAVKKRSEDLSAALAERNTRRNAALAKAPMPVEGLGIAIDDKGDATLTWDGLPFDKDQISTAIQLRVSTAIGMAANPQLRVLRIKDGSLLDANSMAMLASMAETEDFQLWVEVVGDGGVGIIMEDGAVRAPAEQVEEQDGGGDAPLAEENPAPAKKSRGKNPPKADGALL